LVLRAAIEASALGTEVLDGGTFPPHLNRLARASRGALPTQRRARLRVIVFSNPLHSSDTKARAAMDGGAPRG
jgi:hypothetical protein